MITHLLDTNIISSLMRARPPVVMDRLRALGPERVAVSVITAMELRHRADLHPKAARYDAAIDVLLREIPTVPLPIEVTAIGGRLRGTLQQAGLAMGDLDSLIAAHALAAGLVLVTNEGAFARVAGLRLENWAAA